MSCGAFDLSGYLQRTLFSFSSVRDAISSEFYMQPYAGALLFSTTCVGNSGRYTR